MGHGSLPGSALVAAGVGIVFALVAANRSSNLLADSLLRASVSVAPLFLIWFNVSFDVCGFALAAGINRWSAGSSAPRSPPNAAAVAAAAAKDWGANVQGGADPDTDDAHLEPDVNSKVDDRLLVNDASSYAVVTPMTPTGHRLPTPRLRHVALLMCLIYQAGNFLYFVGLGATPLGVSQVVYQSATVFVFIFSALLIRGFIVNPVKILSLLLCIIGVSLVSTAGSGSVIVRNTTSTSTPAKSSSPLFGVFCLLGSASLWALYEVLIPILLPGACTADLNRFIAWRGVWNFVLLWPLPLIEAQITPSKYVFLESDVFFSGPIFLKLLSMALLSVCTSLLIAIGISVTSPLYMRIGATLNAPVSVLWDALVLGRAQSSQSLSGLFLTVGSFVLIVLPCTKSASGETAVSSWSYVCTGLCWGSRCRRVFGAS